MNGIPGYFPGRADRVISPSGHIGDIGPGRPGAFLGGAKVRVADAERRQQPGAAAAGVVISRPEGARTCTTRL